MLVLFYIKSTLVYMYMYTFCLNINTLSKINFKKFLNINITFSQSIGYCFEAYRAPPTVSQAGLTGPAPFKP